MGQLNGLCSMPKMVQWKYLGLEYRLGSMMNLRKERKTGDLTAQCLGDKIMP